MDPKTYYITASADIIKKRAKFLEEKGFEFYSEDEHSIVYRNFEKNIQISVFFERYSDMGIIAKTQPSATSHPGSMRTFSFIRV